MNKKSPIHTGRYNMDYITRDGQPFDLQKRAQEHVKNLVRQQKKKDK